MRAPFFADAAQELGHGGGGGGAGGDRRALAELFGRYNIPAPKTLLVHRDNVDEIIPTSRLPCVLKQPGSSQSIGVVKVET